MGLSGRLEGIAPSDIFQIISQNRMTGTLIARCPDGTAMVVFKDGQVIEAASDAPQESLGHLLVSQGTSNERTIEAARELRKQQPDRPLGAILVDMGAIDQRTLESVVMKQIGQIVHRLMSCDDGFITFDRGETAVKRKLNTGEFYFPSGLSAEFLIMERARAVDEERRKRPDRRAHPGVQPGQAPWDGRERRVAAQPAVAGAGQKLAAALGAARDAAARKIRVAVKAVRGAYADRVAPWSRKMLDRARAFSPDGKALVNAGLGVMAAGVMLVLLFSLSYRPTGGDMVVTGKVVKLRARPSTEAKVVAKIPQGETVVPVAFGDGWHQVRTQDGETGWIWKTLVRQREQKGGMAFKYRVTGGELLLLAGAALLATGVRRRRRTAAAPVRMLRVVK